MENESNENKIDLKTNYTVTMKNGEDFKTELQKNIDQYKYKNPFIYIIIFLYLFFIMNYY